MKKIGVFVALFSILICWSCSDGPEKDTYTLGKGTVHISVDETFKPIIEQEIKVFESNHTEANIIAHYKPESECFKDFFKDSTPLILVTRKLSTAESDIAKTNKIVPTTIALARDGVAVIVHPQSPDSNLSPQNIQGILSQKFERPYTVVFDHQGSSTVRYIQEHLTKGAPLGTNVFAAQSNAEVVEYVSKNKNAMGILGVSYVSDTGDSINEAFLDKVRLVSLYNDSTREYLKPYQAYLALQTYPFTRTLYAINRETIPGLAKGFMNFLMDERGQLLFSKSRLFPLRMNVVIREAAINTD